MAAQWGVVAPGAGSWTWTATVGGVHATSARWVVVAVLVAVAAGVTAGYGARLLLGRLRAPVRVRPGPCELMCAVGWTLVVWRTAVGGLPRWWLPVPLTLIWFALVLAASDLRHRLLPDAVTLPAYPALAALLTAAAVAGPGAELAVRAAIAGAVVLAVHGLVHLTLPGQLGAGDVKLAGSVGAALGAVSWSAVVLGLALAAVTTLALAAVHRSRDAPHGPGLLFATVLLTAFPAGFT